MIFNCLRVRIFNDLGYFYWYYLDILDFIMTQFASFAIGGFVPSAAIAGVLVLIGLGGFFYLGLKGPTDY